MKGQLAGMKEEAAKSEGDPDAYRQGVSAGSNAVAAKTATNQQERSQSRTEESDKANGQEKTSKSGAWMGDTDVDDPF